MTSPPHVAPAAAHLMRRQRPWRVAAIVLLVVGVVGAYCAANLKVTTAITHFLPEGEGRLLADVSRAVSESSLSRMLIVSVHGADTPTLVQSSRAIAQTLAHHPQIESVRAGIDQAMQRAFFDLYFPRRRYFASDDPERELPARVSDAGLAQAAVALERALAQPTGALSSKLAVDDPLGLFTRMTERMSAMRGEGLTTQGGQLITRDGRHAILFVSTRASAFDNHAQGQVLAAIARAVHAQRRGVPGLQHQVSGVALHSIRAQRLIEGDSQRIGLWSSVGALLMLMLVVGRPRYLVLGLLPIALGLLGATAACIAVFGKVHGMTLAFGAAIIGVAVDYPLHYFNHHALSPAGHDPFRTLRSLRPALWVGSATTIAGLSGLAWTTMPGVRELALFSGVGAVVAIAATDQVLPHYLPPAGSATRVQVGLSRWLARLLSHMTARRAWFAASALLACVVSGLGLTQVRFSARVDQLLPEASDLRAVDQQMRDRIEAPDPGRFVIVLAPNMERALAQNDRVFDALAKVSATGALGAAQSLHALLPSAALQQRNEALWRGQVELGPRLVRAFDAAGFVGDAFANSAFVSSPAVPPLRWQDLEGSPLASMVRGFALRVRDQQAVITYLRDVRDPDAVQRAIAEIEGAHYFDQRALLQEVYGVYRARVAELIMAGLLVVLGLLALRHRRWRPTVACIAPAVLGATSALGILALCGVTLDLLHVIGSVLVLSVGEDYAVFLVESTEHGEAVGATVLSIVLACATTVLSFGLLAFSVVPALRSLGQVVGLGTLLALWLSPVGLLWLRPRARTEADA